MYKYFNFIKTRRLFKNNKTFLSNKLSKLTLDIFNEIKDKYKDTNIMFEPPKKVNYHVAQWFNDTPIQLADVVKRFKEKNV